MPVSKKSGSSGPRKVKRKGVLSWIVSIEAESLGWFRKEAAQLSGVRECASLFPQGGIQPPLRAIIRTIRAQTSPNR